jgi:hypothetical protein
MQTSAFTVSDLVLEVPEKLDPNRFDLDAYVDFMDLLCRGRAYQEAALAATLRFLLGGEFTDIGDLAIHNYKRNALLQARYGSLEGMLSTLSLDPPTIRLRCERLKG